MPVRTGIISVLIIAAIVGGLFIARKAFIASKRADDSTQTQPSGGLPQAGDRDQTQNQQTDPTDTNTDNDTDPTPVDTTPTPPDPAPAPTQSDAPQNPPAPVASGPSCTTKVAARPGQVPQSVVDRFCSGSKSDRTVMVIGDSFSEKMAEEYERQAGGNVRFCGLGRGGAEAAQWARDEDLKNVGHGMRSIALAALNGTENPRVVVAMGTADVGNEWLAQGPRIYDRAQCDLEGTFDDILEVAPDAEIVIAGYDITNLRADFTSGKHQDACPNVAASEFGTVLEIQNDKLEVAVPRHVNEILYGLKDVFVSLAGKYSNVKYSPLYGVLQDRPAGSPDLDRFANPNYYLDCVHKSPSGQKKFVDAFKGVWGLY